MRSGGGLQATSRQSSAPHILPSKLQVNHPSNHMLDPAALRTCP